MDMISALQLLSTLLISLVILITCSLLTLNWLQKRKPLPPGPWSLPFIGYSLGEKPHIKLSQLNKRYGDIFSLSLKGRGNVIILSSYNVIKQALVDEENNFISGICERENTFTLAKREAVKIENEAVKFSVATLKQLQEENHLELKIKAEIRHLLPLIISHNGKPHLLNELLQISIINAIFSHVIGNRFHYDDHILKNMAHLLTQLTKENESNFNWPCFLEKYFSNKTCRMKENFVSELKKSILQMISEWNKNKTKIKDQDHFFSIWFTQSEKQGMKVKPNFNKQVLKNVVFESLAFGFKPLSTNLYWSLLFMINYPDVQKKIQREIEKVIGKNRLPSMEDRKQMAYTVSTLMEISRMTANRDSFIAYYAIDDFYVSGQPISNKLLVKPNLWAVHHDAELFPDPYTFKPDRFLVDGAVKRPKEFIPFSVGRNQAIVESFAEMHIFLYFTSLLQNLTFSTESNVALDLDVAIPKPYKIRAFYSGNQS